MTRNPTPCLRARRIVPALLSLLLLAGCGARSSVRDPDPVYDLAAGARVRQSDEGPVPGGAYGPGDLASAAGATIPEQRVIYFALDSDEVLPEYQPVLKAHAAYLAAQPRRSVTLAGHADERGSPEYNVALGERRAKAVQRILELQGVGAEQLVVVSYGEEKPAVLGHDEAAWSRNRRVEFLY